MMLTIIEQTKLSHFSAFMESAPPPPQVHMNIVLTVLILSNMLFYNLKLRKSIIVKCIVK